MLRLCLCLLHLEILGRSCPTHLLFRLVSFQGRSVPPRSSLQPVRPDCHREAASAAESEVAAGAGTAAESAAAARRLGLAAGLAVAVDAGTEKLESGGTEEGVEDGTVAETTVEASGGRRSV